MKRYRQKTNNTTTSRNDGGDQNHHSMSRFVISKRKRIVLSHLSSKRGLEILERKMKQENRYCLNMVGNTLMTVANPTRVQERHNLMKMNMMMILLPKTDQEMPEKKLTFLLASAMGGKQEQNLNISCKLDKFQAFNRIQNE